MDGKCYIAGTFRNLNCIKGLAVRGSAVTGKHEQTFLVGIGALGTHGVYKNIEQFIDVQTGGGIADTPFHGVSETGLSWLV